MKQLSSYFRFLFLGFLQLAAWATHRGSPEDDKAPPRNVRASEKVYPTQDTTPFKRQDLIYDLAMDQVGFPRPGDSLGHTLPGRI